jgi:hypothetical protein
VVADRRPDAGGQRAAPHHRIRVRLQQRPRAQLPGAARDRTEKRSLAVVSDAGAVELLVQIRFKGVMARHLVPFAALWIPSSRKSDRV